MSLKATLSVTAIVVTKNEEARIGRCLDALQDFAEVIVVDSISDDRTQEIAIAKGVRVVDFEWDGRYPKKRQWVLDVLDMAHDWVFWVDADEIVTPALVDEMRTLDFTADGYFVRGRYVFDGRALRFGLKNNKIALMHRTRMAFPVVDDLDIEGMGEIEGHYQPVQTSSAGRVGQLRAALLHDAYDDPQSWQARHERYAVWECAMDERGAWPHDPRLAKRVFKALPFRGAVAFVHCYIWKLGILDGARGFRFALSRLRYYRMI